jgi:hypothetical protein
MGTHVVGPGLAATIGLGAGGHDWSGARCAIDLPVRPVAKTTPIPKQRPKKLATKPPMVRKPSGKKGSLAATNAAAAAAPVDGGEHACEVFAEMPERYISLFLSGELYCLPTCGELECLCATVQPRAGLLGGHAQRSIRRD